MDAMIHKLSTMKATLAATTALVAVGVVVMVPETRDLLTSPLSGLTTPDEETPIPASGSGDEGAGSDADAEKPVLAEADDAGRERLAEELVKPAPAAKKAAPEPQPRTEIAAAEPAPAPAPADAVRRGVTLPGEQESGYAPASVAPPDPMIAPEPDTEAYANEAPNPVKVVTEEPVSTFSIDVDTAAWGVVRSSLMGGYLPPPDAVRVEEMVNYFPYAYPAPEGEHPFQPTVSVMPTPWNPGTQLVHIALQGEMPDIADRPPLNLVFLIDTSGSMQDANKLPLLIQSFRLMLNELRPEDEVAIVTYAGSAGQVLAPTKAADKEKILAALTHLTAGGSTAGQAGLEQAYAVAESMTADGEVSRILLATDGDFNVGISDVEGLEDYIARKRESGTYLSVLGFGRGNLDDATMQALAQNGNGTAAYIDTLSEARKVLVDELTGALFPIADDVKIQVEWNPATVAEYRLIGYETRGLRREDFNNDKVDAGEIGAGVQVTAIYEVTPVGSPAILNDPLRYQPETVAAGDAEELGFLRLRYKKPGEDSSILIETPIPVTAAEAGDEQRFAVAIAGFGQLLRGSTYLGDWTYADAIALANGAKGADEFGYRAEAVSLMRLAESLSGN
ncbi:vWA domain-containing protein [Frigidibacter sp. ROC022]|uniref:vWA domain-containing protein n=1 Tax=Frigidibacter sp. ROC022 TaxID=2971796 RepID=UPI003FCD4FB5